MDAVINDFVQVLRRHRLRVSPAESLDALHALKQVGLGEREVVCDTLRATLIKNQEDTETFDRLFDLFFSLRIRFPYIRPVWITTTIMVRRPRNWSLAMTPRASRSKKRATATTKASR